MELIAKFKSGFMDGKEERIERQLHRLKVPIPIPQERLMDDRDPIETARNRFGVYEYRYRVYGRNVIYAHYEFIGYSA
jgi:hypothetical protein